MDIKLHPKIVNRHFKSVLTNNSRYQIYYGGSSSSKSYSIFTFAPIWALEGRSLLIIRANEAHITKSVWNEVIKSIDRSNLRKFFRINKSERTIVSKVGDGCIMFAGVSDPERIKSINPVKGKAFDTIILEEATELTPDQFNQITLRQRGKCKFKKRILMLFNPILLTHWLYQRFFKMFEGVLDHDSMEFELHKDNVYINKSTYKSNLHLDQEEIDTIESYKTISPYYYEVYALGKFGVLGDVVFDVWNEFQDPSEIPNGSVPRLGIDFGYHDALTFTISFWNKNLKTLYIVDELSFVKLSDMKVFAEAVKEKLIKWNLPLLTIIAADSSAPREADLLRKEGLRIQRAIKGAGSKFAGLIFLKGCRLFVMNSCKGIKESMRQYVWKKTKDGVSTNETLHDGSDLCDAIRYSMESDMRNTKAPFSVDGNIY